MIERIIIAVLVKLMEKGLEKIAMWVVQRIRSKYPQVPEKMENVCNQKATQSKFNAAVARRNEEVKKQANATQRP